MPFNGVQAIVYWIHRNNHANEITIEITTHRAILCPMLESIRCQIMHKIETGLEYDFSFA